MTKRERLRENLRRWRKANPERSRAQGRRAYARHGAAKTRAWREKNKQRDKANARAYNLRNRKRINEKRNAWRKRRGYTEADRAEKRRYYVRHSERLKKKMLAQYFRRKSDPLKYAKYRKEARERLRDWRKRNPAKNVAYVRAWQKKHPEKVRKWDQIGYIRKKGWKPAGSHTVEQWLARVRFYGWRCVYCGKKLDQKTLTKDHRIPLSKGGSEFASNLVPACRQCNSKKHVKHPKNFRLRT